MGEEKKTESELGVSPMHEVIAFVKANDERNRVALGFLTKQELEICEDDRMAAFVCDPFLEGDRIGAESSGKMAVIIVAFASGALPDRIEPALIEILRQKVPIFVLSNNPGDENGITSIKYAAGKGVTRVGSRYPSACLRTLNQRGSIIVLSLI